MIQKDYYKILGVSMDASEVDIKKAYRKLAMQYHPDIPENHNTEEKFKEVSEAASVLTNSEKRKKYDAGRAGAAIKNYSAQTNYAKTSQPGFTELFKTVSKGFQDLKEAWAEAGRECQAKQKKGSTDGFTAGYNINPGNVYTSSGKFKATAGAHIDDMV